MALVFNGSANTIAGLSVGGLPDGCVDTDTLATTARGKLLKTAYKTTTTTGAIIFDSTDWGEIDTNARLSYTPASSSSTIWIYTQASAKVYSGEKYSVLCGVDNGSTIKCINESGASSYDVTFSGTDPTGFSEMFRDSSSSNYKHMHPFGFWGHFISEGTSALTLKLMGRSHTNTDSYLNDNGLASSFYVMEVAA